MSRSVQFPKIFVGTPYNKKLLDSLVLVLEDLPFRTSMARDIMMNRQQIKVCSDLIKWADYCIFDVSGGNANVMLELGLAHGMKSRYFIICNTDHTKIIPSNIEGIQRLNYNSYHKTRAEGLWYQIMSLIGIQNPLIETYWRKFRNTPVGRKQRIFATRLLCRFKDSNFIPNNEIEEIARGLRMHAELIERTINVLRALELIERNSRNIVATRRLFPPLYRTNSNFSN